MRRVSNLNFHCLYQFSQVLKSKSTFEKEFRSCQWKFMSGCKIKNIQKRGGDLQGLQIKKKQKFSSYRKMNG